MISHYVSKAAGLALHILSKSIIIDSREQSLLMQATNLQYPEKESFNELLSKWNSDSLFHLSRSCLATAPSVNAIGTSSCWPLGTATHCDSWRSFQTPNCRVSKNPQRQLPFPVSWDGLSKFYALALHLFRSVECVYWGVPSADPGFVLLETSLTRWSFLSSWQGRIHNITASWMFAGNIRINPFYVDI